MPKENNELSAKQIYEQEKQAKARCSNCAFFIASPQDIRTGQCRRYPPISKLVLTPKGLSTGDDFVMVVGHSFCGEFTLRSSSWQAEEPQANG